MNRYDRQMILPNFGSVTQARLRQSKVLVVGAGGLGVPVLQYLTAAGIGTIGIADGDKVSLTNLHRQVLYHESDIDFPKANIAQSKLSQLNSETAFRVYPFFLDKENVFEIIHDYDIIVDCTDNFGIRYLINDVCCLFSIPLVYASVFQFEVQLSVFHHGKRGGNLRDIFPDIPDENSVPNCNEAGVLGPLAGIAGTLQATEVIKIITSMGKVPEGQLMIYNGLNNTTSMFSIPKNENAFRPKSVEEIRNRSYGFTCAMYQDVDTLEDLYNKINEQQMVLIDVREIHEQPKITSLQVVEMPLSGLDLNASLFKDGQAFIFICQSGVRSRKAIDMLAHLYPNKRFFNITRGIHIFGV